MKKLFTLLLLCLLSIMASAQEEWWGYVSGNEEVNGVGVSTADTYHAAIFIPGDHAIAGGKTIKAIRFGLEAPHATNAKVWVASSLPTTVDSENTLQLKDVPDSKLGSQQIDVELNSPVTIPAEGIYVGYSFTITAASTTEDKYPVLFAGEAAINTLLLKTDVAVKEWGDLVNNDFGRLFLQVLLEGVFEDNNVAVEDFGTAYAALGLSGTAKIKLSNAGLTPVSSIDYTITTDGETSAEQHADIATPIAFNATGTATINIPADATLGQKEKTLTVTKVNGNVNNAAKNTTNFTLTTLPELVERKVVIEEFTGTGCGWCPRGMVGMEKLRQTFGDRFVGIAIHQYNSADAMHIASNAYKPLGFDGAPSCRINRSEVLDPYYGSRQSIVEDFAEEMNAPALAKVNVSATIGEDLKKVKAKANIETLTDNAEYKLEFVVIGDGLKGTGSSWNQANYYIQKTASELPEDLSIFGTGGKYGTSPITGWSFNDVALVSSYVSGSNKAPKLGVMNTGEQKEVEYTLTMPTKTTLKNAVKNAELFIVALIVDGQGKIVNADKQKITIANPAGIENVNTTDDSEQITHYTLDGRRIQTMQKGINIVRMANGKTIKVVSK